MDIRVDSRHFRDLLITFLKTCLLLSKFKSCGARYTDSAIYESVHGLIGAVAMDPISGDLVFTTSNSITKLNFGLQTERTFQLKSQSSVAFKQLSEFKNDSYTFFCSHPEKSCSFLIDNGTDTYTVAVPDETNSFPWTQDALFAMAVDLSEEGRSELFILSNKIKNNRPSQIFSTWSISYEPPKMRSIETSLSVLDIVSPHTFEVITGFLYNDKLYYLARIDPRRKPISTKLLQIDLSENASVIATRLHCGSSFVSDTAYYVESNPETLYISAQSRTQSVCGFQMNDVEQYFRKVWDDCKLLQRGSRITWLEESFTDRDNPCFKYDNSSETRYEAIFAATTLYPTTTTRFPSLFNIESLVVYRSKNLTQCFLADSSGNISKVILDEPGRVLYSKELLPQTVGSERWTTRLKLYKHKLYAIRGNTVQYIDIESCSIHKRNVHCIRDVTACTWCSVDRPKTALFACLPPEECTQQRGYLGPLPEVVRIEPSEGPVSGGIVMTIYGMNLDMVVNRSVTINNRNCDIIHTSVSANQFCCMVPDFELKNRNFIRYTVPVLVTLDSRSISPEYFTYTADPVVIAYTPRTAIASGGTKLTLTGSNLNLVQNVKLSYYRGDERASMGEHPCKGEGADKLICITPLFTAGDLLPLNVSLRLSYTDVINGSKEIFFPLSADLQVSVVEDPVIYGFLEGRYPIYKIDIDINENILVIYGKGFYSIMSDEYNIIISPGHECQPSVITGNKITCNIFGDPSPFSIYSSVKVQIGVNLHFYPGFVYFYNSSENSSVPDTEVFDNKTDIVTNTTSVLTKITADKTVTLTNSSGIFTRQQFVKGVITGTSRIYSATTIPATTSNTSDASFPQNNSRGSANGPNIANSMTLTDKGNDVSLIVAILCAITVICVACIAFRKQLIRKLKYALRSRLRSRDDVNDGDRDDISYSIAPGDTAYSLGSIGEYTVETVMSDDDYDEDISFLLFYKRFEDSNLIVSRDQIQLERIIGQGNFGSVFKGVLTQNDQVTVVAVKTLHKNDARDLNIRAFLKEAYVMKHFHHENVLELLGVCVDDDTNPLVLLPFMPHGDLLKYLHDDNNIPTVKDLVCFGLDIANGMEYLANLKFVHRDLAARNCMLDTNYHVKVADFGLSRDIYETSYYSTEKKGKLPVKWMAMESLATGIFNEKTDVWAFGVTLWELMTRGVRPYAAVDNWDIEKYLRTGRRLPQPLFCPTHLYKMMRKCWSEKPADRPTFTTLKDWIATLLDRVDHPLGDKDRATNIATTYVNLAMGSQYKYDPD